MMNRYDWAITVNATKISMKDEIVSVFSLVMCIGEWLYTCMHSGST